MFGHTFSHDELAKYIAIFGTLFNDIRITRDDVNGKTLQSFKVPIGFGPREKFLARTEGDENLDRGYAELLPRMAFEITGMQYDGSRKMATTQSWNHKTAREGSRSSYIKAYMPVPYNLSIRLSILANRSLDATRIVEQIIPYFTPDWTVTAKIVDELPDLLMDIPIVLTSTSYQDDYEGGFNDRRVLTWNLDFTMRVSFFGPISESKLIKVVKVNFYADKDGKFDDNPSEMVKITPGLTANGEPTTRGANSIPVWKIEETDNYGYVVETVSVPTVIRKENY
jgi:hypothetical protein